MESRTKLICRWRKKEMFHLGGVFVEHYYEMIIGAKD